MNATDPGGKGVDIAMAVIIFVLTGVIGWLARKLLKRDRENEQIAFELRKQRELADAAEKRQLEQENDLLRNRIEGWRADRQRFARRAEELIRNPDLASLAVDVNQWMATTGLNSSPANQHRMQTWTTMAQEAIILSPERTRRIADLIRSVELPGEKEWLESQGL